ncbi:MAG: trigger factor [Dehalococcoidia bacterium]
MKVTVERIPDSQVLLNIEIDPERVESSIDQAYKRLAPRTRIPGFRPGKAPRALVERHYGRDMLLHEALDRLVPLVVKEAIEAESIEIVDQPDLEIASLDPVVVKATVPVRPTVEIGEYRALRVEPEPIVVDPARVDEQLEDLRQRYATVEPVERPVEDGDVVRAVHTSTGSGGITPVGDFKVYAKVLYSWSVPFQVWMPFAAYFRGGIATHQSSDVPSYNASHGCVRLPEGEAERVYRFVDVGTPVSVR